MSHKCGRDMDCWRAYLADKFLGAASFSIRTIGGSVVRDANGLRFEEGEGITPPPVLVSIDPGNRIPICSTCESYTPDTDKCRLYGCSCKMTDQASRPWAQCPLGKWPVVKVNNEPILSPVEV